MKRTLIASVVVLAAASLIAAPEQTTTTTTTTTTADSPLVAAAKKTNRAGKKRIVITDESVKHSTGHVTTTKVLPEVKVRPLETPALQVLAAENKAKQQKENKIAADRAKIEKHAADEKQKRLARMAAAEEEGPYGDDSEQVEQPDDQAKAGATPQTAPPKPPATKHP